ncbi:unnamed protein product [Penicillium salamii]|nr:unnamed protein product [Penicillium salamii]CAG8326223.1 unnamed protein product [Penicillium salamii]
MDDFHDRLYLSSLEGSQIETEAKPYLSLPREVWVIAKHLEEHGTTMSQEDVDLGRGHPLTTTKFLCYREDDPTQKPAFMRIYHQIPVLDTEYSKATVRSRQAFPIMEPVELQALRILKKKGSQVNPAFLGYQLGQQEPDDIVPGGFFTCIVWDKVPGEALTSEYFWNLNRQDCDSIRREFRRVYDFCLSWSSQGPLHPQILFMMKFLNRCSYISGFSGAAFPNTSQQWTDSLYVRYDLAEPCKRIDWALYPSEWKF